MNAIRVANRQNLRSILLNMKDRRSEVEQMITELAVEKMGYGSLVRFRWDCFGNGLEIIYKRKEVLKCISACAEYQAGIYHTITIDYGNYELGTGMGTEARTRVGTDQSGLLRAVQNAITNILNSHPRLLDPA